jgi:hypothetical protein
LSGRKRSHHAAPGASRDIADRSRGAGRHPSRFQAAADRWPGCRQGSPRDASEQRAFADGLPFDRRQTGAARGTKTGPGQPRADNPSRTRPDASARQRPGKDSADRLRYTEGTKIAFVGEALRFEG